MWGIWTVIRNSTSWNILLGSTSPRGRTELNEVDAHQPDGEQDAPEEVMRSPKATAASTCHGLEGAELRGGDSRATAAWAGLPLSASERGRSLPSGQGFTTWIRSQTVPRAFPVHPSASPPPPPPGIRSQLRPQCVCTQGPEHHQL